MSAFPSNSTPHVVDFALLKPSTATIFFYLSSISSRQTRLASLSNPAELFFSLKCVILPSLASPDRPSRVFLSLTHPPPLTRTFLQHLHHTAIDFFASIPFTNPQPWLLSASIRSSLTSAGNYSLPLLYFPSFQPREIDDPPLESPIL